MLLCSRTSSFTNRKLIESVLMLHWLMIFYKLSKSSRHWNTWATKHSLPYPECVGSSLFLHLWSSTVFKQVCQAVCVFIFLWECRASSMCSILAGRVQVDKKAFKTETHLTDRKALMSRFALPAIKGHSVALDSINVHLKTQTEKNITIPTRLCQVIM